MTCIAIRYLISFMVFLAFTLDAASRSAMSITLIAMVNNTIGVQHESVMEKRFREVPGSGSFNWDTTTQGYVQNSVYIGILLSQLPAGHLAESFSLKWVLGYGIFFMSVLTLFAPLFAEWSVYVFIVARIIGGLSVGVIFPCANSLISRWSPRQDLTLMITIAIQGYSFGPIVASIFAGTICEKLGWRYVFYVLGCAGILWSLLWYFVVASSPEKHWWISEEEKMKILEEREGNFDRDRVIPWRKIVTSAPVLILCIRTLAIYVPYAIFFTYMPTFLAHMYKISLTMDGWIIGTSIVTTSIVALISSALADRLLQAGYSINLVRKTFATVSVISQALMCFVMIQLESNFKTVVIVFVILSTVWGFYGGSDAALPIDLSAEYAGAISALQNVFANLSLILVPIVVGWFIEVKEDFAHWNVIFAVGSIIAIFGAIVFLVFGTAEKQDWSPSHEQNDDNQSLVDPL